MKKSTLKRLDEFTDNAVRLKEMRIEIKRLQEEADILEERIEEIMTEEDRIVLEAQKTEVERR